METVNRRGRVKTYDTCYVDRKLGEDASWSSEKIRWPKNDLTRSPENDCVVKTSMTKEERRHARDKRNQIKGYIAGLATAITVLGSVYGGKAVVNSFSGPEENFDAQGRTVFEAANFCDVDPRAILLANGLSDENEIIDEIVLPEKYGVLDEEIAEAEKAAQQASSDEELAQAKEKLSELEERQARQDELAEVYVVEDGKFAYIIPKESGIDGEEIKSAFGIKDGVLRKYNSLPFEWGFDKEIGEGYRDYTGQPIPYEGVRVPKDELGKEY